MKNKLFRLLCLILLLTCSPSVLSAQTVTVDGIFYEISGNCACVSLNSGASGVVNIRASVTYNGVDYPVTYIETSAFLDCSGLTKITMPNSITSIYMNAFLGCTGLTEITLSESLTSIGMGAFGYCSSLMEITLPESLTTIENYAFFGCTGLTKITLSESLTLIRDGAFRDCSGLTEITLPESLTTIGSNAFAGCSGLKSLAVPENVKTLGGGAFDGCHLDDLVIKGTGLGNYTGSNTEQYTFLATVDAGTDVYAPLSVIPDGNDRLIPLEAPRVIKDLECYEHSAKFRLERNKYYDGPERDVVLSLGDTVIHPDENGGCTVDGLSPATAYTLQVKWGEGDGTSYRRHFTTAQSTGVHSLEIDGPEPEITGYYDLTGRRYDAPQRGFNIVLYSDGTTRKITVR